MPFVGLHDLFKYFPFVANFFELQRFLSFVLEDRGFVSLNEDRFGCVPFDSYFQVADTDVDVFALVAHVCFVGNPIIEIHVFGCETFIVAAPVGFHISGLPALPPFFK